MFKVKLCYLPFFIRAYSSHDSSQQDENGYRLSLSLGRQQLPSLPFYLSAEISSSDTFPSADVLSIHPWPAFITLERELASWYLNNVIFFPR